MPDAYLFHFVDESLRDLSGQFVESGDLLQITNGTVLVVGPQAVITG